MNEKVIPAYAKVSLPPDKIHVNAIAAMSIVFDSVQTSIIYFFLVLVYFSRILNSGLSFKQKQQ